MTPAKPERNESSSEEEPEIIVPKMTPGKQYKSFIRGGALEFENVGRLKDQTVE